MGILLGTNRAPVVADLFSFCYVRDFIISLSDDSQADIITKTCVYTIDPLKPHFYVVKLGFIGVVNIFLISAQKKRLWVLVRTASLRRF